MLSREKFADMPLAEEDEEIEEGFYVNRIEEVAPNFCENEYEKELRQIGKFL
jgi:redox-regulated HSP33 family molecular chaperone